jgi:hypothetical protein
MIRTRVLKAKAVNFEPWRIVALAVALGALYCGTLRAETIAVDDQVAVRNSDVDCPGRGMTMKTVEAKFGAPQERHEAVGVPPISRWDYPTFSVFFEHEYVIHSVVNAGS